MSLGRPQLLMPPAPAAEAVAVFAPCLDPGIAEDMPNGYALLPALTRLALTRLALAADTMPERPGQGESI
jgi:hypothetical protein